MAIAVKGGPELRARLGALASAQMKVNMNRAWQDQTGQDARTTAPSRTGRGRASIKPGFVSQTKAYVNGAYWLIFIDRGTKAHDIRPKGVSGSGRGGRSDTKVLAFDWQGKTIFAKKIHRRRMVRRPFITEAARKALASGAMADQIVQTWNRKRAGRFTRTRA